MFVIYCISGSVVSDSSWSQGLQPTARFLCAWNSPGKTPGVICYSDYIQLWCNNAFHRNNTEKANTNIEKTFSVLQDSILKSTMVQFNSWYTKAGSEWTGKRETMEDGRAEGPSAIGCRGQAVISLTPDVDGTGSCSLLDSVLSVVDRTW